MKTTNECNQLTETENSGLSLTIHVTWEKGFLFKDLHGTEALPRYLETQLSQIPCYLKQKPVSFDLIAIFQLTL